MEQSKVKQVLWISRHSMPQEQLEQLEDFLGSAVELTVWSDTVEEMEELRPVIEQADVVAAVLPLDKMSQLMELAGTKPVMQGVTKRVLIPASQPGEEPTVTYTFDHWQQILCCQFRTSTCLVS